MKYRLTFLLFILLCWALGVNAQHDNFPSWVSKRPVSEKKSYYYRVTIGEGENYDKAYAKAFARAIMESSWKLGVEVKTTDDLQTIENNITSNVEVVSSRMTLPMNKVCEYIEPLSGRMGVRIYILWQVARQGNIAPDFDEFLNCE